MRDISMHILDIVGNSVRAKATQVKVTIEESLDNDFFKVIIKDNGIGMDSKTIERSMDPFFTSRTTRRVGLGIPLLQQNTELTGGNLSIESAPGEGTTITALFVRSHIDRPPIGDMSETMSLLMTGNPNVNMVYQHSIDEESYQISSQDISEALGNVKITEPFVLKYIREMINENLMELGVEI